ncbi:MAG: zf-HC2 domain-containing protein [Chloroflexi bacterium]|nr:zf-HC2 domain-containing protein [Chloroflexota bacterium]
MTACERAKELLTRRQPLTTNEQAQLEQHLRACPQCQVYAWGLQEVERRLSAPPVAAAPPQLLQRIMVQVQGEARRESERRRSRIGSAPLLVGAAVLVMLAVWWGALLAGAFPLLVHRETGVLFSALWALSGVAELLGRGLLGLLRLAEPLLRLVAASAATSSLLLLLAALVTGLRGRPVQRLQ